MQPSALLSSADSSPSSTGGSGCFSKPAYRTLGPGSAYRTLGPTPYAAHYSKPEKKSVSKVGPCSLLCAHVLWFSLNSLLFQMKMKRRHRNSAPEWGGAYCNLGDLGQSCLLKVMKSKQ